MCFTEIIWGFSSMCVWTFNWIFPPTFVVYTKMTITLNPLKLLQKKLWSHLRSAMTLQCHLHWGWDAEIKRNTSSTLINMNTTDRNWVYELLKEVLLHLKWPIGDAVSMVTSDLHIKCAALKYSYTRHIISNLNKNNPYPHHLWHQNNHVNTIHKLGLVNQRT